MEKVEIQATEENAANVEIKINGNIIPHVFTYNIKQNVYSEVPFLDLEILGSSIFFEGEAEVNISNVICDNKEMAQQMHDILEEKYDLD